MLDYFLLSEKGERENNEDFIFCMVIDDNNACFFLADGLGGHGRGDEASRLAVQTAESYFKEHYSEGDVMEKMIRSHPDRNRLLRVVGEQWSGLSYEFMEPVERKHDSDFLMCTDGFWELVDEKAMKKTLKSSENAMEWIKSMRDIVMNTVTEKEKDNFSAIGIRL